MSVNPSEKLMKASMKYTVLISLAKSEIFAKFTVLLMNWTRRGKHGPVTARPGVVYLVSFCYQKHPSRV